MSAHRYRVMRFLPAGVLAVLSSAACMTAGSGPVTLYPEARTVRVVHTASQVRGCVPLRSVQVSDGIARREQNRVQDGDQEHAYSRLKKVTAHEGGDTALIIEESYQLNLEPPTLVWKLDASLFQCAVERAEAGQ